MAIYDPHAKRKTVSITLNADLHAKAREYGLNESRIAESAIATALEEHVREVVAQGVAMEMHRYTDFVEREGRFAEKLQVTDGTV